MSANPKCPYCGNDAELVDSARVYNGRSYGLIWDCRPCDAYVGVHKGTENPLGTLANKQTRVWRMKAHAVFDPLWKELGMGRREAYQLMQELLGIPAEEAHISRMDVDGCIAVVQAFQVRAKAAARPRIDSKPGVATKRTDFSLPDCGCTHVAPWVHCAHTAA